MAATIWSTENPGESIEQLADVVFVSLRRMPGVAAAKWELDEEVVLDRYLTSNAAWSAQIRGRQAVVQGELRRLKEQVQRLTVYKDNNVPDAIQTLIKHLDSSPEEPARADLKAKLERVQELMKAKVAKLQDAIQANEAEASGGLFDTDDPTKLRHRYLLRAVLWHDGFLTPGRHLYAYIREGDAWFRIQDEVAEKVAWDEVQADTTGQFTDGGPYLLVYSRDGPRPSEPVQMQMPTSQAQTQTAHELIDLDGDVEMDDATTIGDESEILIKPFPPAGDVPAAAPAPAQPPAERRSRTPSPVKGAVRGPRPLPKPGAAGETREGRSGTPGDAPTTSPAKLDTSNAKDTDDDLVM